MIRAHHKSEGLHDHVISKSVYNNVCIIDRSRSRQVRKPLSKEQKEAEARVALKSISELTKSPKSDGGKKPDLRARYWKFLFDNLQRAVDAIYETCEQDESALECRVCIMGGLRDLL